MMNETEVKSQLTSVSSQFYFSFSGKPKTSGLKFSGDLVQIRANLTLSKVLISQKFDEIEPCQQNSSSKDLFVALKRN